jgi:predicted nucleic-acid-binding protein
MPTRIVDTVVLIAFSNENDPLNEKASSYIFEIAVGKDILVPSATLLEFDLELKTHGISDKDRMNIHSKLKPLISADKVLPLTPAVLERASQISPKAKWRGAYFDTLIVAAGLESGATSAITTDHRFHKLGLPAIF